jgi:iron complex transport system ATP-binding protein
MTSDSSRNCRHGREPIRAAAPERSNVSAVGAIRVEKLTMRFGNTCALNEVSVSIPTGCLTTIVGPPGSGKTVLLKSLACELPWGSGAVWIQDVPARLWPSKKREACVRTCPVARGLPCPVFDPTVCGPARDNEGDGRLDSAKGLDESFRLLGVEHLHGRCRATLADRDRRRIELAETLAPFLMNSDARCLHLWLDDPLDGIDNLHQHQLLQWLKGTAASRHTTIVTATDHGLIRLYADHSVLLAGGRVVSEGNPATALRSHYLTEAFEIA